MVRRIERPGEKLTSGEAAMSSILPSLEINELDGVAVARLSGELDAGNIEGVEKAIAAALETAPRALVIDLSDVTYLDSASVGLLFKLSRRLQARRKRLAVVSPPASPIRRLLALSDLASAAEVVNGLEDALRRLREEP